MYAQQIDTFFVEIPRTGMRSLEYDLNDIFKISHVGHYTTQRFLDDIKTTPSNYVAVVRDPVDRLLSAINFACLDTKQVDQAFDKLLREGYSTEIIAPTCFEELGYVYAPQIAYMDADVDYKLYKFGDMKNFYKDWVSGKEPTHNNKTNKWFSREELINHPMFNDVMQIYKKDVDLYGSLEPIQ